MIGLVPDIYSCFMVIMLQNNPRKHPRNNYEAAHKKIFS